MGIFSGRIYFQGGSVIGRKSYNFVRIFYFNRTMYKKKQINIPGDSLWVLVRILCTSCRLNFIINICVTVLCHQCGW